MTRVSLNYENMSSWMRIKYSDLKTKLQPYSLKLSGLSSQQRRSAVILAVLVVCAVILLVANTRGDVETPAEKRSKRDVDQISLSNSGGAVFTRWGRSTCPTTTCLVYEGITGGSGHTNEGGGSNYVCLPLNPVYESELSHNQHAKMYGSEYKDIDSLFNQQLQDHNPPCAVCQSTLRANMMMIPAQKECFPGWHAEYSGYLVAQHRGHVGKTEFVCLDGDPEMDQAGYRNENGALMYRVQGVCGSLPCPPYKEGMPLICVVWTK